MKILLYTIMGIIVFDIIFMGILIRRAYKEGKFKKDYIEYEEDDEY